MIKVSGKENLISKDYAKNRLSGNPLLAWFRLSCGAQKKGEFSISSSI